MGSLLRFIVATSILPGCLEALPGGREPEVEPSVSDAYSPEAVVPEVVEGDAQGDVDRGAPCLGIAPATLAFGAKLVASTSRLEVTLTSCGQAALELREIALEEGSSDQFSLDPVEGVGGMNSLGREGSPLVLQPGAQLTLSVAYVPRDLTGDSGALLIATGTSDGVQRVPISGHGVMNPECPTAVITSPHGEEVIPQTRISLDGSESYSSGAEIATWEWSVVQPVGSASAFQPSSTQPSPTFEVNVAGTYTFRLTVTDQYGTRSCVPAELVVYVVPSHVIHVELLWTTPNDQSQTDENGADLDLHFLHPFAKGHDADGDGIPDGWFDKVWDTFWFNTQPNWGDLRSVDDDPSLDRDDVDGAGPENLNFDVPVPGETYRVGVHYWNHHDFGGSHATVRVYYYASLVFEIGDVLLEHQDMWCVAVLAWPEHPTPCLSPIIHNYSHPDWIQLD